MSVKKPSIEEQMAQSIFYNLSILKLAVKSTSDFDENLSNTMFIKSNTKAFIHITHYLFNIIDPKEFKAKFYWPLAEKKSENSYRSSSIDLINSLIDKHSLKHEKVKLVFVVHPGGKKFMSLILDLITIAIKEVMKRRRIAPGQSFSMATVMQTCINMKEVETDLVNSIKEETKLVKDKTRAIQDLINKDIFPEGDLPLPFQEFIAAWHENNKAQFAAIKSRDNQMNEIYKQTAELQIRAQELLATKSFEIVEPSPQVIKEIADFYENVGLNDDTIPEPVVNEKLNFAWLIVQLHLVLPSIINYVTSFKLEASESNVEELKVVQRLASELSKIESKIIDFSAKFKNVIGELIVKLKKAKEERQQNEQEIESPEKIAAKLFKNQIELENLKLLSSPRYYFDTTKECLRHVVIEKKRLAMLDDETKENLANETKLYRPAKSPYMNKSRLNQSSMVNQMGPPKQQLRRRLDPMELMNRATAGTSRNRRDFDSTARYTGAIPKTSQGFSSTMLSPCLHQPLFNCSTVSEISNNSPATPVMTVENIFHETEKLLQPKDFDLNIFKTQTKPVFSPQDISWNDEEKMMKYHTSPRGGLTSLVRAEEIFKQPPKLTVNELTLLLGNETVKDPSTSPETSETTIVNKSDTKSFSLLSADENLFNTSDTILNELSD